MPGSSEGGPERPEGPFAMLQRLFEETYGWADDHPKRKAGASGGHSPGADASEQRAEAGTAPGPHPEGVAQPAGQFRMPPSVPPIFRRARPGDLDGLPLAIERPRSLFIYGANGVGKSYAAAVLAAAWKLQWVSVPWLVLRVRRTFKSNAEESELGVIQDLVEVRGLMLDDLLACAKTDFGLSTIFALINARVEHQRLTVVTCDRDLEAIDALDSGLASRLSSFSLLKVDGEDRRVGG